MKKIIQNLSIFILIFLLLFCGAPLVPFAEEEPAKSKPPAITVSAPSAILMEASTGTICYAKEEEKQLPMASVTKVMTLLLILEAVEKGQLSLSQEITVSEHAASMGGSQVFLEAGEVQTVETLIKCISIASANDASVAMAEAVAGTEEEFVVRMNQKAKALHMEHTNFVNCCGLDAENHYSCAKDLAFASRELITKYPEIFDYCTIWQEDITHTTRKGSKPFTLTNTNKLIKQYPFATGLKTGSTSLAKFCLSATAEKDGMHFIAVVMAAPTPKERFRDATTLLNYGFANTAYYRDDISGETHNVSIGKGVESSVSASPSGDFHFLAVHGENIAAIRKKVVIEKNLEAPVKKGQTLGVVNYYIGDKKIGSVPILAKNGVPEADYLFYLKQLFFQLSLAENKFGR